MRWSNVFCSTSAVVLLLVVGLSVDGSLTGCRCDETPVSDSTASSTDERQRPLPPIERGVRPAALAGSWYSDSAEDLQHSIEALLDNVENVEGTEPLGFVVPHAGHSYSGQTAAYAYSSVVGRSYRRVFVLAPCHRGGFTGAAVPAVGYFQTPLGRIPIDIDVTDALAGRPGFIMDDDPHETEHSIEIQLPFLQTVLDQGYRLVPILIGHLDAHSAETLAEEIRPFVGPNDLVLASSDFTHYGESYGYVPFETDIPAGIEALDMAAFAAIETLSAATLQAYRDQTEITVCGYRPIMVFLELLPDETDLAMLHYDTSGNQEGNYERSVSYLAIAATGAQWPQLESPEDDGATEVLSPEQQGDALLLARTVLEEYVREGRVLDLDDVDIDTSGVLSEDLGVFVTLTIDGHLRGCIGNIWPDQPLAEAIVGRTVDAAANDPRFEAVTSDELDDIEIEISVLTEPQRVSGHEDIIIGRHGIVLHKNGRRAVFLPQVAPEQGWDLAETLTQLSWKAGLSGDAWMSGAEFDVFEAQVFSESGHE